VVSSNEDESSDGDLGDCVDSYGVIGDPCTTTTTEYNIDKYFNETHRETASNRLGQAQDVGL